VWYNDWGLVTLTCPPKTGPEDELENRPTMNKMGVGMKKKGFTGEQIIGKPREAEILLG
jgi:hypothetical protein